MGEYLTRDPKDPAYVPESKGMDAATAKAFAELAGVSTAVQQDPKLAMAKMIASQTGKSVEEVLAFMGTGTPAPAPATAEVVEEPVEVLEEVKNEKPAKVVVPVSDVPDDEKFIVTEVVDVEDASEADLDKLAEEEDDVQDFSGKIRLGSKVKIVYQVQASRINWIGKKGKVVRIVGNERAKVFDVEFQGGKIPKIRLNKKTGKLEKGYVKKVIRNTFSEDQLELAD